MSETSKKLSFHGERIASCELVEEDDQVNVATNKKCQGRSADEDDFNGDFRAWLNHLIPRLKALPVFAVCVYLAWKLMML
jgi:hypothetical protein